MTRTSKQNRSIHLLFQMVADELNDKQLDMRTVLKPSVEIPWTKDTVKEYLWKNIQEVYCNKKSTTQIDTHEIDEIFDILNRHLSEKFQVSIEFPSINQLMQNNE